MSKNTFKPISLNPCAKRYPGSISLLKFPEKGEIDEPIRILARDDPPVFECENCKKIATQICSSCREDYCDDCIEKHECGEDYMMPLVNSPRTGVCGYFGSLEE